MLRKPTTAFATFDGAAARAFLYRRAEGRLVPLDGFPMSGAKKPALDDSPGRVFQSFSDRRSAAEPQSDPEKTLERRFVAEVAEKLESLRASRSFDRLIVAAGPRALGYWRETACEALQDAVKKELPADYVNTGEGDLVAVIEKAFF